MAGGRRAIVLVLLAGAAAVLFGTVSARQLFPPTDRWRGLHDTGGAYL